MAARQRRVGGVRDVDGLVQKLVHVDVAELRPQALRHVLEVEEGVLGGERHGAVHRRRPAGHAEHLRVGERLAGAHDAHGVRRVGGRFEHVGLVAVRPQGRCRRRVAAAELHVRHRLVVALHEFQEEVDAEAEVAENVEVHIVGIGAGSGFQMLFGQRKRFVTKDLGCRQKVHEPRIDAFFQALDERLLRLLDLHHVRVLGEFHARPEPAGALEHVVVVQAVHHGLHVQLDVDGLFDVEFHTFLLLSCTLSSCPCRQPCHFSPVHRTRRGKASSLSHSPAGLTPSCASAMWRMTASTS